MLREKRRLEREAFRERVREQVASSTTRLVTVPTKWIRGEAYQQNPVTFNWLKVA